MPFADPIKRKQYQQQYYAKHQERLREVERLRSQRKRNDPKYRVRLNESTLRYRHSPKGQQVSRAYRQRIKERLMEYSRNPINKDRSNQRRRDRYHADAEFKARRLSSNMHRKFGRTLQEYDAKVKEQGGLCAACKLPLDFSGRRPPWDHDHVTGQMRGIIHKRCNIAIGEAHEDAGTLRLLADYLEKYRT